MNLKNLALNNNQNTKFTHLDLFSGIGGFSLAASWMKWETVAQVEWDKYCQKVLAKNFPDTLRFGDIVEFNKMLQDGKIESFTTNNKCVGRKKGASKKMQQQKQESKGSDAGNICAKIKSIGRIDIITGGFPCQPFSHAGKRKGTDDSRYLWPEMLTTIRILKPSFVVGENVAGLVSMENGKTLDNILSDLANEGYQTEQFIIPACGVGAWHRRDRLWIIAYHKSTECQFTRDTRSGRNGSTDYSCNVSDTINQGLQRRKGSKLSECTGKQFIREGNTQNNGKYWQSEPSVGRVANGISNRVDRLKGLGNSIVPQVVFEIFKAIEQIN